jgi:hypothetical protein
MCRTSNTMVKTSPTPIFSEKVFTILFALALSASALSGCSAAHGATCSALMAQQADSEIDNMDTWTKVYEFFRKYKSCDDGSISEGLSEAIARILLDSAGTFSAENQQAFRNKGFQQFVVRHINTTLDTVDLEKISKLTNERCAKEFIDLCTEIKSKAKQAIKYQK